MREFLIVVDMQNDFIDGALGTPEASALVLPMAKAIATFPGSVIFTRDTHEEDYLQTQEGRLLPVIHTKKGTPGWEIPAALLYACKKSTIIDKPTFGSPVLANLLAQEDKKTHIDRVTLIGVCTDICVIANAMLLKAFLPETEIAVVPSLCAGVTPQAHEVALQAMKACQIKILSDFSGVWGQLVHNCAE